MTILSVFDIGLAVLILGIGVWTITAREAFAAVIAFVVYGLLLALFAAFAAVAFVRSASDQEIEVSKATSGE